MSRVRCLGVIALALAAASCTSKETRARENFSKSYSCPLGDVTATEHEELSAWDLTFGELKPLPDIASDPARVAMWQAEHDRKRKENDANTTVFVAKGCNQKKYYGCSRSNAKQGSNVSCTPMVAPVP